jgi:type III restriction enzyme
MHYDVDGRTGVFECIVDSATGVGKTYVLAGLIEYLALADPPAKNYLILAPGRTIRDKTVRNFTPGDRKSLTTGMRSAPYLVTADNFDSPATRVVMDDPTRTKVYVFTVQALTTATGEGRATHDFQEGLGASFYEWLSRLDDLVVIADEHHCYRGPAFSSTIRELHPKLVVGLTATPDKGDEKLVVYRYPLAAAIADRLVKTPVVVGRRDDRNDVETKLLDGVSLLRLKQTAADQFCRENDLPRLNPVMLVIARDIGEAEEFRDVLDSVSFDQGRWAGKTLLVHSKLTGDHKERALSDLEAVEEPDSPVRIIINVGMLKEGWDVKNVYVIASMRASVSEVLTEQTLGRGLRLPFGAYTGIEFLDTLEVLAHERYEQLLAKRNVLNDGFIDYYTYAETRQRPDGTVTVATRHEPVDADVIPDPVNEPSTGATASPAPAAPATGPAAICDFDARQRDGITETTNQDKPVTYLPLADREPIVIPRLVQKVVPAAVSLNDIFDYTGFEKLGRALAGDYTNDLKRTKIVAQRVDDRTVQVGLREAQGGYQATLALDIPLETSRQGLLRAVMAVKGVQQRPAEVGAAKRIVDKMIDQMGPEAAVTLSAFGDRCAQRLKDQVSEMLRQAGSAQVRFEDTVEMTVLDKPRISSRRQSDDHADGAFDRSVAFDGWTKSLYPYAWFDVTPEYKVAQALDRDDNTVLVWARLHRNDIPITWNSEGRQYNPDHVAIEIVEGGRHGWLIETKADVNMTSEEVVGKKRGALKWVNVANALGGDNTKWHYLLLSETDVKDAQGNWEFLKGFGA